MELRVETSPRLAHTTTVGTSLVLYGQLLTLSRAQLEARVDRELARNPALTREEGRGTPGPVGRVPRSRAGDASAEWEAAGPSAREQLLADVAPELDATGRRIAGYVLSDLDDRGVLDRSPADLSRELHVTEAQVKAVIAALRRTGPATLAARDVRELLLLALDALPPPTDGSAEVAAELARRLVRDHLTLLADSPAALAERTGTTVDAVEQALSRLRQVTLPRLDEPPCAGGRAAPDVLATWSRDGGLVVELATDAAPVCVDRDYRRLCGRLSGAEASTASAQLREAAQLVDLLERRAGTVRRVAELALHAQSARLRHGRAAHVALSRAQAAQALGIHPSTVSRAVAGKHVRLPDGQVVPLADLFGSSTATVEALRRALADHPGLTDARLVEVLRARGVVLARRTVAKHRAALGVPARV